MPSPLSREAGCRSVDNYECLNFIDEGTYGLVYRARDIASGRIYALKQVKLDRESKHGFPVTVLREITLLLSLSHRNVIATREVVTGTSTDAFYLVMEYAAQDLLRLLEARRRPYAAAEVKALLAQLLAAVAYLHARWVIHRDLKPANLLLAADGVLKVADFGLARRYADPLGKYTPGVVTLWYRAPELLMAAPRYSTAVDVWSVGCIFAELLLGDPLFQGRGELEQLSQMTAVLGAPSEQTWKGYDQLPNAKRLNFRDNKESSLKEHMRERVSETRASDAALDLLQRMLTYDPERRISAADAQKHEYFAERPRPKDASLIQTFPDDRVKLERETR